MLDGRCLICDRPRDVATRGHPQSFDLVGAPVECSDRICQHRPVAELGDHVFFTSHPVPQGTGRPVPEVVDELLLGDRVGHHTLRGIGGCRCP